MFMIRDLAVDYPDFTIVIANWYAIVAQQGYFDNRDDHDKDKTIFQIFQFMQSDNFTTD